jgi:hypothetical protein
MLGLGWNAVVGAAQRSNVMGNALVRAAMLPAGTVVGLAFAALTVVALKRLPQMSETQ